jgi:transposase
MTMFAGLDVGFKRTAICVVDERGEIVWRGIVDTHPEALSAGVRPWRRELAKIGLESGSLSSWLARGLGAAGFAVVCMEEERAP